MGSSIRRSHYMLLFNKHWSSLGALVLAVGLTLPGLPQIACAADGPTATVVAASVHQAPPGARLLTVPAFEPGKPAWVSVYDQAGRALPGVSVLVNGTPFKSDELGQVSFTVPSAKEVTLSLQSESGNQVEINKYARTPAGYLTTEASASGALDELEGAVETTELAPMIAYAPAAIETSQPFVLLAKNLTGKAEADRIVLDGYDADVFAGSTISLLATAPKRISVGPIREMYVTARGESSNIMEVDVCRVECNLAERTSDSNECANVRVIGSNMPALVELQNGAPDAVSLTYQGKKLGSKSTFVTPGGDSNKIVLGATHNAKTVPEMYTHLISDAPWCSTDDKSVLNDPNFRRIVAELNKAEIVRLKRRQIAVEKRLLDEQTKRTKLMSDGQLQAVDLDKMNAELRSLSNRQSRINSTICARRAVFQSLGGQDAEYREALEQASGNAAFSLEKNLTPVVTAAMIASTSANASISIPNFEDGGMLNTEELQSKGKALVQSMEALSKMWRKYPIKQAHAGRLAAPPEPYIPNLGQIFPPNGANYTEYARLSVPPPPPILLQQLNRMKRNRAPGAASAARKGKHSNNSKHSRSGFKRKFAAR